MNATSPTIFPPTAQHRPPWWVYLLLPLLHFASVKLTYFCGLTPENEVVVWLPNAVLLAALLRYQGQRGWAMAALTYSSDVLASLSAFSVSGAVLLPTTATVLAAEQTNQTNQEKPATPPEDAPKDAGNEHTGHH